MPIVSRAEGGGFLEASRLRPPGGEPPVTSVLGLIARALREWRSPGCVEIDSSGRVVGGAEIYWALVKLGARRVPVAGCEAALDELGVYDDFEKRPEGEVYRGAMELLWRSKPTPLVMLRWKPGGPARVWAKLEWFNPFSLSIKDRPAAYILERSGLPRGASVYDASSSNFAVALSSVAALLGYKARVYLPGFARGGFGEVFSRLAGAEVVVDEEASMTPQLVARVARDAERDGAVHVNQFINDYNFEAHLRWTAREIDYQRLKAGLRLSGVAGGVGTSGHMSAIAFYFKHRLGGVDAILAQPAPGEVIPGIRRRETGMLWLTTLDVEYNLYDVTQEEALEVMEEVARSDGLFIGPSGAAALSALRKHCEEKGCSGDYVAVIPDTGLKYTSLVTSRA